MVYREAWGVFLDSHTIPTNCLEILKKTPKTTPLPLKAQVEC